MSSGTSSWRQRREAARTRRALDRALGRNLGPAMEQELAVLAGNGSFHGLTR